MLDTTVGFRNLALRARMSLLATRAAAFCGSTPLGPRRTTFATLSMPPLPLLKLLAKSGILFAQCRNLLQSLFQPTFEIGDAL
jgi:hypothetical protein